ncbi:hypothetical protein ACEPAI_1811 [Sanghuangporus weigelae]
MPLQPGVYYLQNLKSDTVLDLSGVNYKSIIGQSMHGGRNQQWEIGKLGTRGWFIRSLSSANGHYLTVEKGLGDNIPLVGNEFPVAWDLRNEPQEGEDVYGIYWPFTRFTVNLHWGSSANGSPVNLWSRNPEHRHELWRFMRCSDEVQTSTTVMHPSDTEVGSTTVTTITTTTTTKVVTTRNGVELTN